MQNPWLAINLRDYEGHMGSENVRQLEALSDLFKRALDVCAPISVAILGIAGGNGLEHVDTSTTKRIIGIDINAQYLDAVRQRYPQLKGLELYCADLATQQLELSPVDIVHVALVFEHTGLGRCLENALSLVAPGGNLSVVLQLPGKAAQEIAATPYESMQSLRGHFALIDVAELQRAVMTKGFQRTHEEQRALPGGKAFWLGIFVRGMC